MQCNDVDIANPWAEQKRCWFSCHGRGIRSSNRGGGGSRKPCVVEAEVRRRRDPAVTRNIVVLGSGALLVGLALYALTDDVRRQLVRIVAGLPRGCGADGFESIPALLLLYGATGAAFWAWEHPTASKGERVASFATLIGLIVLNVGGTAALVNVASGFGCMT